MLFQRYANPMLMIDKMIRMGRFNEFVNEVMRIRKAETEDKTLWELWLHKVFDKSFNDFTASLNINTNTNKSDVPSEDDLIATVTGSVGILSGFNLSE